MRAVYRHAQVQRLRDSRVFLGAATLGIGRPDLAARFGARFGDAGFTLTTAPLPGVYTLAVFARSAATLTFSQVRTLTIFVD
jgi:hypothetical protein